jgi:hypothetical protein
VKPKADLGFRPSTAFPVFETDSHACFPGGSFTT